MFRVCSAGNLAAWGIGAGSNRGNGFSNKSGETHLQVFLSSFGPPMGTPGIIVQPKRSAGTMQLER